MKAIPSSYCIWCEEHLATKEHFPYCGAFCKSRAWLSDRKKK